MEQQRDIPGLILGRALREFAAAWPRPVENAEIGWIVLDLSEGRGVGISEENVRIERKALGWLHEAGYVRVRENNSIWSGSLTEKGLTFLRSLDAFHAFQNESSLHHKEKRVFNQNFAFQLDVAVADAIGAPFRAVTHAR